MPADKVRQVFGPHGDPTVTRTLPFSIDSRKYIAFLLYRLLLLTRFILGKRMEDVPPSYSVLAELMSLSFTTYGKP